MQGLRNICTEASFEIHRTANGLARPAAIVMFPGAIVRRRAEDSVIGNAGRIAKAVAFIHQNAHRPFELEELLEICAMPRRTFEQAFAARLGIDLYSFINRCRIERACMLLSQRRKHLVKNVASMSGFSSERRFRSVFRRLMGIPATEYRSKKMNRSRLERTSLGKNERVKTDGALACQETMLPVRF